MSIFALLFEIFRVGGMVLIFRYASQTVTYVGEPSIKTYIALVVVLSITKGGSVLAWWWGISPHVIYIGSQLDSKLRCGRVRLK